MTTYFFLLFISCSIYPTYSSSLFDIQDTLTILCYQFPLISSINDSSLQCARLRLDNDIPSSDFNLNNPSQIGLFIIIDQLPSISPVNININFNQSLDNSSSINEIYISILVVHSNYMINNQSTTIYSSNDILILYWNNSQPDLYNPVDLIHLNSDEYETDSSMCQWNTDQWNRLFNINSSYGYFLKTTNTNLIFTLINTQTMLPPSPYLNILYCIPYKLGLTELILLIFSAVFFLLFLIILGILNYCKVDDNLMEHFQQQRTSIKHISFLNSDMNPVDDDDTKSIETEIIN